MLIGPDYVRLQGKTESSAQTAKVTRLTHSHLVPRSALGDAAFAHAVGATTIET